MQRQTVRRGSITVTETPDRQPSQAPVVLVVTGDTDLREASARALAREGYTVITAAHAGHAVLACITAGRVDLLLAELSMEDMSGPALAARLRRQIPDLATIFVADAGTLELRRAAGAAVHPRRPPRGARNQDRHRHPEPYFGILKSESSSGTLNSTLVYLICTTCLPFANCVTVNGTIRPSTVVKSENRISIFIF